MKTLYIEMATPTLRSGRLHRAIRGGILLCFVGIAVGANVVPAAAQERVMFTANEDALHAIVQRINAEQVRVDIATWLLGDGDLQGAIVNKWKSGVQVRVIGDRASIFEGEPNTRAAFEYLASNGVPIRLREYPRDVLQIMHWKAGIFVGQGVAEFGSGNYTTFELMPWTSWNFHDELAMFT